MQCERSGNLFHHQGVNGRGGLITDGDTQWMTAGSRIVMMSVVRAVLTSTNAKVREAIMPALTVDDLLVSSAPLPGVA